MTTKSGNPATGIVTAPQTEGQGVTQPARVEDLLIDLEEKILEVAGNNGIGTIDNEELMKVLFGDCAANIEGIYTPTGPCEEEEFREMLKNILEMEEEEFIEILEEASNE